MPRTYPKSFRAGFGPHCNATLAGREQRGSQTVEVWVAKWGETLARNADGTARAFGSQAAARAWLAAADVTNGATVRPV